MLTVPCVSHTPSIHSPQPHRGVIRLTTSLPKNTFICNQSAKSKLHKWVFLKNMSITSTPICWRTNKETSQKSPVLALHVNRWDRHRISCEGQGRVGWEKNLVKALALPIKNLLLGCPHPAYSLFTHWVIRCITHLLVKHRMILCKQYLQNYKAQEVRCVSLVWPLRNLS